MRALLLAVLLTTSPAMAQSISNEYTPAVTPFALAQIQNTDGSISYKQVQLAPNAVPHLVGPGFKTLGKRAAFPFLHPIKLTLEITHPVRHPQLAMNSWSHWVQTTPNGPGYSALARIGEDTMGIGTDVALFSFLRCRWHR